jgi:hypothetical protein
VSLCSCLGLRQVSEGGGKAFCMPGFLVTALYPTSEEERQGEETLNLTWTLSLTLSDLGFSTTLSCGCIIATDR